MLLTYGVRICLHSKTVDIAVFHSSVRWVFSMYNNVGATLAAKSTLLGPYAELWTTLGPDFTLKLTTTKHRTQLTLLYFNRTT